MITKRVYLNDDEISALKDEYVVIRRMKIAGHNVKVEISLPYLSEREVL